MDTADAGSWDGNVSLRNTHTNHMNTGDIIPFEVIESWLKGDYQVGTTQSTGYRYIGWSLLLRGFYVYKTLMKTGEIGHWGYMYIDLKDGDLYFAGVRLFTSGDFWSSKTKSSTHPIYWRSIFSKFVGLGESIPRVYFPYIAHTVQESPVRQEAEGRKEGDGRFYTVEDSEADAQGKRDAGGPYYWHFKENMRDVLAYDTDRGQTQDAQPSRGAVPRLTLSQEKGLKGIDKFWADIRRDCPGGVLPEKPSHADVGLENRILTYLADRSGFDSHMRILDSLMGTTDIMALVYIDLERPEGPDQSINPNEFKADFHPLSQKVPEGIGKSHFTLKRITDFCITKFVEDEPNHGR